MRPPPAIDSSFESSAFGSTQAQRFEIATDNLWEGSFNLVVTVRDRRTRQSAEARQFLDPRERLTSEGGVADKSPAQTGPRGEGREETSLLVETGSSRGAPRRAAELATGLVSSRLESVRRTIRDLNCGRPPSFAPRCGNLRPDLSVHRKIKVIMIDQEPDSWLPQKNGSDTGSHGHCRRDPGTLRRVRACGSPGVRD